jgi:mannose-6-phosphate isomerase-like protein (cupin superfamily)
LTSYRVREPEEEDVSGAFKAVRLSEIPSPTKVAERAEAGDPTWHPIRHHLDIGAFGVNAWSGDEGAEVIESHTEASGHEELYVVVSGRAAFTLDGEEVDAPAGTLVYAPGPETQRVAVAREPGTIVLALGGWRDRAFEVSEWERRWTD